MNLTEFAKEVHRLAVDKGWWDEGTEGKSFAEIIALCHSELSEALEEYRDGNPLCYCVDRENCCNYPEYCTDCLSGIIRKPEGTAIELADCIIRILDWCGKEDIDIELILQIKHDYNKTRPYRHGGKRC